MEESKLDADTKPQVHKFKEAGNQAFKSEF